MPGKRRGGWAKPDQKMQKKKKKGDPLNKSGLDPGAAKGNWARGKDEKGKV